MTRAIIGTPIRVGMFTAACYSYMILLLVSRQSREDSPLLANVRLSQAKIFRRATIYDGQFLSYAIVRLSYSQIRVCPCLPSRERSPASSIDTRAIFRFNSICIKLATANFTEIRCAMHDNITRIILILFDEFRWVFSSLTHIYPSIYSNFITCPLLLVVCKKVYVYRDEIEGRSISVTQLVFQSRFVDRQWNSIVVLIISMSRYICPPVMLSSSLLISHSFSSPFPLTRQLFARPWRSSNENAARHRTLVEPFQNRTCSGSRADY